MTVDPEIQKAVANAKPATFGYSRYIVKAILFHLYFVPTTIILFPYYILLACLPILGKKYHNWTVVEAVGVFITQRAMRNLIRFRMQPLPPREKGWREMDNALGGLLSLLNLSGPGGLVSSIRPVVSQVAQYTREGRRDSDWFDPPPLDYLKGILTIKVGNNQVRDSKDYQGPALVEPKWAKTRVKGFWFMHNHTHSPIPGPSGSQKRSVLLYFHGGAGVTFAAGDIFMGQTLCKSISSQVQVDIFSVDYNLSPFSCFPVPILQALAGYLHLIHNYGYHPSQIMIGGDSFGAWIALQLENYLRTDGHDIVKNWSHKAPTLSGVPRLLLLSPWVCAYDTKTESRSRDGLARFDILRLEYGDWGLDAMRVGPKYKDRCPAPLTNPWLSPAKFSQADMRELPPCFVCLGSVEAIHDEDSQFVKELQKSGADVKLYVDIGAVHDYGTMSTFGDRFRKTLTAVKQWVNASLAE
ncbi:hypothetical protein MYAM1_000343 [Malassezia yamatoensis]|uniref:Alpha/beta hydrolase fold-3 domain-containing protein n=1 Tax=Malassezia yamatoensis TaxID=253288 RepID=A0AAJ5YR18_9BASI|nr:hypothetical protein MYAM1_000343 [Malassezia yamatoensis]